MSNSNTPELTNNTPSNAAADDVLRDIGRSILHGIDTSSKLYRDSPPEAIMSSVLRLLLRSEIEAGRIHIHTRERIVLPVTPALAAELDIVLHQPGTGAWGVVEIQGWAWHRRTQFEHDREIRRERLLRRSYLHLEVYSATEVMESPWSIALEIVDLLGGVWGSFSRVDVPVSMRALAVACAGQSQHEAATEAEPRDDSAAPEPIAMLGRLRELVDSLPPLPPCVDPALQAIRRSVPRAYVSWTPTEAELLREAYQMWIDIDDIAQALKRTPGAVWAQLRRMGLVAE